jgi:hypothetical protein
MLPLRLSPRGREVLDILSFVRELSLRGRLKRADLDKRLALVHTDNAVELMLKDYLCSVEKIPLKHVNELAQSYYKLLGRCCKLKTVQQYENEFKQLHDVRNKLYHENEFWISPKDDWVESCISLAEQLFEEIYGSSPIELSRKELRATLTLYKDYLMILEARFREKGPAPGAPWTTIVTGSDAIQVFGKEFHFYAHWMPSRPKIFGGLRTEVMLKCNTSFTPFTLREIEDVVSFCHLIFKERGKGFAFGKPIHRFWLGFASFNGFEADAVEYVKKCVLKGVGVALVDLKQACVVAKSRNEEGENAAHWFRV